MKLQFGFEDVAYADRYTEESPLSASVKKRRPQTLSKAQEKYGSGKTTGEISQKLDEKYHIMEKFFEMEIDFIGEVIEDAVERSLEGLFTGQVTTKMVTEKDTAKIERRFRQDLNQRKFDGVISGVPTQAAQQGISHLRKRPSMAVRSRPSFVDTGLYSRSFRVWTEE